MRTVDVMIRRVRRVMNGNSFVDPNRTIKGSGYKFSEFLEEQHCEWPT